MNTLKKINKLLFILIISLIMFIVTSPEVKADSLLHTKGGQIWPDQGYYLSRHFLGGEPAYCIQWDYGSPGNVMYNPYSPSAITERKKFISGKIIEDINATTSLTSDEKIVYINRALNTLLGLPGSRDFSYKPEIMNYINNATKYVDTVETLCTGNNTPNCFNYEKFTLNYNNTMNQIGTSSDFISNKITLTGLLSSYGGTGTKYTISISSSNNSNISICSNSNGTGCTGTSVTLNNPTDSYSFYVKVTGATPSSVINISAKGENSATYPYAEAYIYSEWYQALMMLREKTVTRSISRSGTLHIPDVTKYTITATKTDEYGDNLTGASFRVYRADSSGKEIKELAKNSNGSATLSYTETEFATSNEWFNYQYCLVETSSPLGYIYGAKEREPLCVKPESTKTSICYDTNGKNTGDTELCQTHAKYCSSDIGTLDEASGKCIITNSKTEVDGGLIVKEIKEPNVKDNHSCEGEFTYNNTSGLCELLVSEEPKEDNTCEEGFTLNTENNKCEKKETKEATNNPTYTCDEGYSHEKDEEDKTICSRYTCSDETYSYSSEEKVCKKVSDPNKCKRVSDNKEVDMLYCNINSQEYTLVTTSNNSINFVKTNSKNSVTISKTDITGENEISGAKMKICTTKPNDNLDCELAYVTQKGKCSSDSEKKGLCKNNSDGTMNIYMQWISDIAPRTWRGLKTDTNYYLVETVAPLGYSISSYISFKVSKEGTVTVGDKVVEDNKIIVENTLTKITISKQDIATSKELPGATLKLCLAAYDDKGKVHTIVDEEGNCTIPVLEDGSEAIWESSNTPKELVGLPAATYYLIETITPDDYDIAEKILFTLNQDGTITDEKGKEIKDNKIVMYDKKLTPPPTGAAIIVIAVLGLAGLAGGTVYYLKKVKPKRG